jgi:hypothetical protein
LPALIRAQADHLRVPGNGRAIDPCSATGDQSPRLTLRRGKVETDQGPQHGRRTGHANNALRKNEEEGKFREAAGVTERRLTACRRTPPTA